MIIIPQKKKGGLKKNGKRMFSSAVAEIVMFVFAMIMFLGYIIRMKPADENILYNKWKPLRNFLRKLNAEESLEVIWWYSWATIPPLGWNENLPPFPNMDVDPRIIRNYSSPLLMWDLNQLSEEIVLNSSASLGEKTLKRSKFFALAINKLKFVLDGVTELAISPENVLDELFRISHQQFRYQKKPGLFFIRYYKIWGDIEVSKIIKKRLGIPYYELIWGGVSLWSVFLKYPVINKISSDTENRAIEKILPIVSWSFSEANEEIKKVHRIDSSYPYQYNPLVSRPMINFGTNEEPRYVCPIPMDLQRRLTSGFYYDLIDDERFADGENFGVAFGNSFQNYIGEVLRTTLGDKMVFPEEDEQNLRRCDWIVDQAASTLFIETKTKRPKTAAYSPIVDLSERDSELAKLADAVVQAYESYINYRDNKYKDPRFRYSEMKAASICVVSMEDWYPIGKIAEIVDEKVKQKLTAKNINSSIIDDVPYLILSSEEFEEFAYYLKMYDSGRLIRSFKKKTPWDSFVSMRNYIDSEYALRYEYVFASELEKILQDLRSRSL